MAERQQFDTFRATFRPERNDDLRPGVEHLVGQSTVWQASWIIEPDDRSDGGYAGQWACLVHPMVGDEIDEDEMRKWLGVGWVPECDLEADE